MPVNLNRLYLNSIIVSLSTPSAHYSRGKIDVRQVEIPNTDRKKTSYVYVPLGKEGEEVPISRYGPNRVVMQEGGLVQRTKQDG